MTAIGQIDHILETATLLLYGPDVNRLKERHIKDFNKAGLEGETFLNSFAENYYDFVAGFQARRIRHPNDLCFSMDSYDFNNLAALPLLLDQELIRKADTYSKASLQALVLQSCNVIFNTETALSDTVTTDEILSVIAAMKISKEMKWELLELLQDPIPFYRQFCAMITANLPVFEKICMEHREYIDTAISQFRFFTGQSAWQAHNPQTVPMLSNPFSMFILQDTCYCGVYWDKITNHHTSDQMDSESLAEVFKAIADKSRLEILSLLREKPVYNLELSQSLSLSPATVSHHMNTLIVRNMVSLEKKGGCTYYYLNRDVISDYIRQLEHKIL